MLTFVLSLSTEEATSPDSGVKERGERGERREGGEASRSASPASRASPVPDERDDIEHSIPATLIQDPNVERWVMWFTNQAWQEFLQTCVKYRSLYSFVSVVLKAFFWC